MATLSLQVLYPQPTDVAQFELDYQEHLALFHEKILTPKHNPPYTVTKFIPTPFGDAAFYQMFTLPFESIDELQQALMSPEMQLVAADAVRISSGGAPVILVGSEAKS